MGKLLIVVLVLIVALYLGSAVVGCHQHQATSSDEQNRQQLSDQPPPFAGWIAGGLGWMSPRFDIAALAVKGAGLKARALTLAKGAASIITVAKADAGVRQLTLVLAQPPATGAAAVVLEDFQCDDPHFTGIKPGAMIPNPQEAKKGAKADAQKLHTCSIPIPADGAHFTLRATADCTLTIQ